jgi:hypothetical protein
MLLVLLLVAMLLAMNLQHHAAALRPELWVPADVSERTVG